MKKQKRLKNNDGGLSSLKEQRDKLLKSDDQVVRKKLFYFDFRVEYQGD